MTASGGGAGGGDAGGGAAGGEAAAACPSTLILGAAKSGTTALFYAVRDAMIRRLGRPVVGLFEPRTPADFVSYLDESSDPALLCKALLGVTLRGNPRLIERFDRKVVIFRDPRDNVVSRILYMPAKLTRNAGPGVNEAFLDVLRRKEADPASLSVGAIVAELERLTGQEGLAEKIRANSLLPADMVRKYGDRYFMFPYVDMVEGRFSALSDYLGFPVEADYAVGERHDYVARSKGFGEWKSWFLPEDLAFFVAARADDFRLLGFDPEERPEPAASIDAETGSLYLARQFQRIRERKRAGREERRARELSEVQEKAAAAAAAAVAAGADAATPTGAAQIEMARQEAERAARRERRARRRGKDADPG